MEREERGEGKENADRGGRVGGKERVRKGEEGRSPIAPTVICRRLCQA